LFQFNIVISYYACSLATKLLVFITKNARIDSSINLVEYEDMFEQTKNAMYSLILKCEKEETVSERENYLKV
jgi:hypothetical protein